MAVRIRMQRTGKTNRPSYRIVVMDSREARDGNVLEVVGSYDPLSKKEEIVVKAERVRHWLSHGALPTEKVAVILKKQGIVA